MDLKNDHNVYILGAGFSCDAGLPMITGFLTCMRDSHEWLVERGRIAEASAYIDSKRFRFSKWEFGSPVSPLRMVKSSASRASAELRSTFQPLNYSLDSIYGSPM